MAMPFKIFSLFSPSKANASWIQTFELRIMNQLFYCCATIKDNTTQKLVSLFSQFEQASAGFKPSNLEL
jgi:hypothetical protein